MFIISQFFVAMSQVLDIALEIYKWIVIASALISFVNSDPYNSIAKFLRNTTEPIFRLIKIYIPTVIYNVDFVPFIVILIIIFLQKFLVLIIYNFGINLR
jgi:YggT family protein